MDPMYLGIYDLSGIQSFIFATNKLREMIGGSILVNKGLFENVPQVFKEQRDAWLTREDFSLGKDEAGKVVYIGGGNAMVIFSSEATAKSMTRELSKMIFLQTGGKIKLCSAWIKLQPEENFPTAQKRLMKLLDDNKCVTPNIYTAGCFSLNAYDNVSYEPLLYFEESTAVRVRQEQNNNNGVFATKSSYYKTEAFYENKRAKGNSAYFKELYHAPALKGLNYTDNFDKFQEENGKNFLAVLHIDGNTMGMQIRNYVEGLSGLSVNDALLKMNQLSVWIDDVFQKVLIATISQVYSDIIKQDQNKKKTVTIDFRPIVIDGDDITVICSGDKALPFAELFAANLAEVKNKNEILNIKDFPGDSPFALSTGIGIAFCNYGFPFSTAYCIAEECCKNAKKAVLARGEEGKSSLDFQICYSGITQDVNSFRSKNYVYRCSDSLKYQLHLRPYIFATGDKKNAKFDYQQSFADKWGEICKYLNDDSANKEGFIARSKLKGLRNAYGTSYLQANIYGDFLLARSEIDKDREIAVKLQQPFYEAETTDLAQQIIYAKYFDLLDVMDFLPVKVPDALNGVVQEGGTA